MTKRKIIIDTDPGVDDAFAIALALKYDGFDVIGITSSMGNKTLDITTNNSVKLAKYFNANCMVYKGEPEYITSSLKVDAGSVHGDDGFGGHSNLLEYDEKYLSDISAVDFILSSIEKYPNEIEIIALAPLTNIASAIARNKDRMKQLKAIYSMGGGINRGNATKYAEFNYYVDPKALEITYSIGEDIDIYMFGLDITHHTIFSNNDLMFLKKACGQLGELLGKFSDAYLDIYWEYEGYLGCVIHDLLVPAYMIDNSICPTIKKAKLTTEIDGDKKGITKCTFNNKSNNANIIASVDTFRFKKLFFKTLFGEEIVNKYAEVIKRNNDCNNNYEIKLVL